MENIKMSPFSKTLETIASEEAKLQEKKNEARQEALNMINELIGLFNFEASQLDFTPKAAAAPKQKQRAKAAAKVKAPKRAVAPKYRVEDGRTWTGRGLKPKFIVEALEQGKSLDDLLIKES